MMPARCVPWPNGSPVTPGSSDTRLTRATTRESSAVCVAMPESRIATPTPLPGVAGRAAEAEQPPGVPCQTDVGAGDLVGDRHVADDRQVARDVREERVALQRLELRVGDFQCATAPRAARGAGGRAAPRRSDASAAASALHDDAVQCARPGACVDEVGGDASAPGAGRRRAPTEPRQTARATGSAKMERFICMVPVVPF